MDQLHPTHWRPRWGKHVYHIDRQASRYDCRCLSMYSSVMYMSTNQAVSHHASQPASKYERRHAGKHARRHTTSMQGGKQACKEANKYARKHESKHARRHASKHACKQTGQRWSWHDLGKLCSCTCLPLQSGRPRGHALTSGRKDS